MNSKNHLPSFTMLELITVLTISTVVISMAYTAYEVIYKDFSDYKSKMINTLTTMDFVTILERDINKSDSLQLDKYNFRIFQRNNTIQYDFDDEKTVRFVIKYPYIADTFQIKIHNFTIENQYLFLEYAPNYSQYESSIYTLSIHL